MKKVDNLNHVTNILENGEMILVLDTGAVIGPQSEAMIQALHSRSVGGVKEHLKKLKERGSEKFMETFYVGYGHKSIGDCGTCTIFIENVSMLTAKAIQDWPLYSGQEASTRYIDFSKQRFVDPVGTPESKKILENWRSFYLKGVAELPSVLKNRYPIEEGESEKRYEKAINALAFDIMRGFLPAGAATNLAWHSNLRQISDKLMRLRHHPLAEVRRVAKGIENAVMEAFPSSFSKKRYEQTESYNRAWMESDYYFKNPDCPDFEVSRENLDLDLIGRYRYLLTNRPEKAELPKFLNEVGTMQFQFLLDFGSFRDIQRHRAVNQRMPLVTTEHGFGEWYIDSLSDSLKEEVEQLLKSQEGLISKLDISETDAQYYIAMGYNLPNRLTGTLPALIYLIELRATRHVHPTLSYRATQMAEALKYRIGNVLHIDDEPRRFNIQRGDHDIVDKVK